MAPIPSRLSEEVQSLIASIERRYIYISETSVPELRKCTGPVSLQQRLAEDVREDTVTLARQIESLDIMVDDQQGERNRGQLREIVVDMQRKLEILKQDTRAALLASKRAIELNLRSRKEELLSRPAVYNEKQTASEKTAEDALMQANSDVTDALRRTIALMQSELERSVLSNQLLDESTASLRATSLQHDTLNSVMSTSKQLVTALEKSDWLDRILILSGFAFFILVILFILKQRIVDRGIRMAFWWTRLIPSFKSDSSLLQNAEKGMASAVAEASSTFATITTSLVSVSNVIYASSTSNPAEAVTATPDTSSIAQSISTVVTSEDSIVPSASYQETTSSSTVPPSDVPVHVEL